MRIVIDSREKQPLDFSLYPDVEVAIGTLQAGDYSIMGFTAEIAIERKSVNDLIGFLTHDRDRFKHELERLRGYRSALVVVEAPFDAIRRGQYHSRMNPDAAVESIFSMMQQYRIPFYFADNRADGAFAAFSFLRHFLRHETERAKRLGFALNA